jgi:hypothetical protein
MADLGCNEGHFDSSLAGGKLAIFPNISLNALRGSHVHWIVVTVL